MAYFGIGEITVTFVFLFGASIGSFLNVCIYRIPRNISIIFPQSQCPACSKKLSVIDMVPILSFLLLRGKCRFCHSNISKRYFIVEFITGLLTLLVFQWHGLTLIGIESIIFIYLLIAIFFIDLEFQIIPDSLVIAGVVSGVLFGLLSQLSNWLDMVIGALIGGGFLFLSSVAGSRIFKRESMGGGDIKLGFMMGLILGIQNIVVGLFSAFLCAALFEGGRMLIKGKLPKGVIPFGPYLAIGAVVGLLFGDIISDIYIAWFFMT